MQALVFRSTIGKNVVIEPGAKVIGVTVPDGRYVPTGMAVTKQADADNLPQITDDYPFAKLNAGVLEVNEAFADAYLAVAKGEAPKGGEAKEETSAAKGTAKKPESGKAKAATKAHE